MNRDEFLSELQQQGYDNIRELVCEPNQRRQLHTHDSTIRVLVLSGEWTLATENGSTDYRPGETCLVPAGERHAELTGGQGATILLGEK